MRHVQCGGLITVLYLFGAGQAVVTSSGATDTHLIGEGAPVRSSLFAAALGKMPAKPSPKAKTTAGKCSKPGYQEIKDLSEAEPRLRKSIGRVFCLQARGGMGTGFLISDQGHMATNFHVVATGPTGTPLNKQTPCKNLVVMFHPGLVKYRATIAAYTPEFDLAILKLDKSPGRPALGLSPHGQIKGQTAFTLGFPGDADTLLDLKKTRFRDCIRCVIDNKRPNCQALCERFLDPTMSKGIIRQEPHTKVPGARTPHVAQIGVKISGGNSGGPLFDMCGRVVGITTLHLVMNFQGVSIDKGRYYAIDSRDLLSSVKEHKLSHRVLQGPCPPMKCKTGKRSKKRLILIIGLVLLTAAVVGGVVLWRLVKKSKEQTGTGAPGGPGDAGENNGGGGGNGLEPDQPTAGGHLEGLKGQYRGETLPLCSKPLVLGRDPEVCDLVFDPDTAGISKKHAEVKFEDGGVQVRDSYSKLGTFLDGKRLSPGQWTAAEPGQQLRLGDGDISFKIG